MDDLCMMPFGCEGLGIFFLILLIILSIAVLVFWIMALVHQAKRKRWVWFVLTLIFNVTWLIYWVVWLVDPKFRRKKR